MTQSYADSCPTPRQQDVAQAEGKKANSRIGQHDGKDMLQLLRDCSGAFRPGILTALVGSSGAGKTTLMVRTHALPV